jgi:hypothetical protein
MKNLLRASATATLLALLSTSVAAMAVRADGPVSKAAAAKAQGTLAARAPSSFLDVAAKAALDGESCTAVSKEADGARADCLALTAALAVAETSLRNAENNLAVFISAYNACLAQPGWDCSYWEAQIATAYDVLVQAEIAFEAAASGWVAGGCEGFPLDPNKEE